MILARHSIRKMIFIIIVILLLKVFSCHQYFESERIINQLNKYFRFDHNIFLMESTIDQFRWFLPLSSCCNFTPQTVYTFADNSYSDDNITDHLVDVITSKNQFLIAVFDGLEFENDSQLLAQVKSI